MKPIAKPIRLSLILSAVVWLAACGFQLRGSVDLAEGIEPIAVIGLDSNNPFGYQLSNLLSAYGVQLTDEPGQANHLLEITDQKRDKRSVALGEGARVAEYQLTEIITFILTDKQGKPVLGPNTLTERKIVPNDPNKVVSTGEEEKILRREMQQNLAAKIARQLQSFDYPASTAGGQ